MHFKYGLIGNPGAVMPGLAAQVELVPFRKGETKGLDGVLVAGAEVDRNDLAEIFAAGLPVVAMNADAGLLTRLQDVSGVAGPPAPLIMYRPVAGSPGEFQISTAGFSGEVFAEEGTTASSAGEIPDSFFAPAQPTNPQAGDGGEFLPQATGAAVGRESVSIPILASYNRPLQCDKRMKERNGTQKADGNYRADIYIYWTDGAQEVTPRFVVILVQTARFNPAAAQPGVSGLEKTNTLTWEGWSKGVLMPQFDLIPTILRAEKSADGQNWSSADGNVSLSAVAPLDDSKKVEQGKEKGGKSADQSEPPKGEQAVDFQYPGMGLRVNDESGARSRSIVFTPKYSAVNRFKEFRSRNLTTGLAPAWRFHEESPWNPHVDLPKDWDHWHRNVYDPNQHNHVKEFPDQSRMPIAVSAVCAWEIASECTKASGTAPTPLPMRIYIKGGCRAMMAAIHMHWGCELPNGHHRWIIEPEWTFDRTLRLDQICKTK